MAIAGKVAITPGGEWSVDVAYDKLVVVTFGNNVYLSIKPSTGIEPTNEEYWVLLIENVTQEQYDNILNGTTAVGNALKLNGLTAEEFVSNDNLLINSDFRNPVNTNGLTSYGGYRWTIDKWFVNYDTSVTINDGYITIGGDNNLRQTFDEPLPNGTYTATFRAKSSDGCMCYLEAQDTINGASLGSVTVTLTSEWEEYTFTFTGSPNLIWTGITGPSRGQGLSYDVEWVKLEKGSIATPFIPPNKEVEKLKCGATDFLSYIGVVANSGYNIDKAITEGLYDVSPNKISMIGNKNSKMIVMVYDALITQVAFTSTMVVRRSSADGGTTWDSWVNISDGGNASLLGGIAPSEFYLKTVESATTPTEDPNTTTRARIRTVHANCPTANDNYIIETTFTDGNNDVSEKRQTAYGTGGNNVVYNRAKAYGGVWTPWEKGAKASEVLPLNGSVPMSGNLRVATGYGLVASDILLASLTACNTQDDYANCRSLIVYNSLADDKGGVAIRHTRNGVTTENTVLHTGNSQKVVTSASAPSDTSALWYDTTNKILKRYVDGAWQA